MKPFRTEIKIKVTVARGIIDDAAFSDADTELDTAIIKIAGRKLRDSRLNVFFFAYRCVDDWQTICDLYNANPKKKKAELPAVKRYGRDVVRLLRTEAKNAPELDAWEKKYRERLRRKQ